jgi:hypothetical protein
MKRLPGSTGVSPANVSAINKPKPFAPARRQRSQGAQLHRPASGISGDMGHFHIAAPETDPLR